MYSFFVITTAQQGEVASNVMLKQKWLVGLMASGKGKHDADQMTSGTRVLWQSTCWKTFSIMWKEHIKMFYIMCLIGPGEDWVA